MGNKDHYLRTPIDAAQLEDLRLDDIVYLTGRLFTIRDWSHQRIAQLLEKGEKVKIPFDLRGMGVLHSGPIVAEKQEGGWEAVSVGATSSSRFSPFIPPLVRDLHPGVLVGKGHLDQGIVKDLVREKCPFLQAVGGCAALYASQIKRIVNRYWPEFGMVDAVWEFEVENFGPLSVEIDLQGNTSYRLFRSGELLKNLSRVYDEAGLSKEADYVWWPKVMPGSKSAFDYATKIEKE